MDMHFVLLITLIYSSSISNEWLIDYGASYHMDKDQAIFSTMHECNTKKIFVGDDRSLRVEMIGSQHSA